MPGQRKQKEKRARQKRQRKNGTSGGDDAPPGDAGTEPGVHPEDVLESVSFHSSGEVFDLVSGTDPPEEDDDTPAISPEERKAFLREENLRKLRERKRQARERGQAPGGACTNRKKLVRQEQRQLVESLQEMFANAPDTREGVPPGTPHPLSQVSYAEMVKVIRSDPAAIQRLVMSMDGDKISAARLIGNIVDESVDDVDDALGDAFEPEASAVPTV